MSKTAKATVGLIIVTILSKVLGFGRELVLGATYGASMYSDVYITSMNIPIVLFSCIGTALGTTFIPLYYENKNLGGESKSLEFVNNILNIVTIISIVISVLGFIFAEPLVKIFAIGFKGYKFEMAVNFTRIMTFGGIFISINNIISSVLQAKGNFIIPGTVGIPFNIIIIISIILSSKMNMYILPIGTFIAMASQVLTLLPYAYKNGYKYRFKVAIRDEYVKKMVWLIAPVFVGVAVNQVNIMIDKTLASTLVEGSISALNYASRLNGFVVSLFITSISTVIYPMLSRLSSENNQSEFKESVVKSINSVVILVMPISIGAIVLANPIVKVLFERGAFNERATNMTAIALAFYAVGIIGMGLREILGRVFYSLQDTKTPMVNSSMAIVLNIILNFILIKFMGYSGLALATSISSIVCILLLFKSLKKKIGNFGQNKIINTLIKSLISSIIMGIVVIFLYNFLSKIIINGLISEIFVLFVTVGIGVIIYGILAIILKIEEIRIFTDFVKKRLRDN